MLFAKLIMMNFKISKHFWKFSEIYIYIFCYYDNRSTNMFSSVNMSATDKTSPKPDWACLCACCQFLIFFKMSLNIM